jgi:hypothetical protein
MEYSTAKSIRGRSLSSMVTQGIRSGGGVGSSIRSAISQKMRARMTGIKEKFDPMNVAKFLTGGSNLAPAILGRLTGRSQSDINYFSGGRKTATRVGKSSMLGRMSEDSVGSLSELFTFIKKSHEQDLRIRESERSFQEERVNEDQRRHNEFIKILKDYVGSTGTATIVKEEEKKSSLLDFFKNMAIKLFEKLIEPFKWLLQNKKLLSNIFRLFLGPLGGILLAGSAIVWLADELKDYFRANVANQNVVSPEKALELLQTPGAFREIEKYGGREALMKIAKEGHIEAAKILATNDPKKINDAGGEDFLKSVVARGAIDIPKELEKQLVKGDLSQFEPQGPKRPSGAGAGVKLQQEGWDKKYSKIYDPQTGKRLDLLENEKSSELMREGRRTSPGFSPATTPENATTPSSGASMMPVATTPSSGASMMPVTPQSAAVYPASSENAMLNMGGGYVDSVTPIVASSVNNTSTDDVISAPASIRDSTVILSRVFRQSSAYV